MKRYVICCIDAGWGQQHRMVTSMQGVRVNAYYLSQCKMCMLQLSHNSTASPEQTCWAAQIVDAQHEMERYIANQYADMQA